MFKPQWFILAQTILGLLLNHLTFAVVQSVDI